MFSSAQPRGRVQAGGVARMARRARGRACASAALVRASSRSSSAACCSAVPSCGAGASASWRSASRCRHPARGHVRQHGRAGPRARRGRGRSPSAVGDCSAKRRTQLAEHRDQVDRTSASVLAAVTWTRKPTSFLRDERERGHRDVDAALVQEAADSVDLLVVGERDLDDREARGVGGADVHLAAARRGCVWSCATRRRAGIAAVAVDLEAGQRRSRARRPATGPEYRYGGASTFSASFSRVGRREEREQRRVRLRQPAHEHGVVVRHAVVAEQAVAPRAVRRTARRASARR